MATREMKVCDLCGKPHSDMNGTLLLNGTNYGEICNDCVTKLGNYIEKLKHPELSQYAKQKARKAAKRASEGQEEIPTEEREEESAPVQQEKKGPLGRNRR